MELTKKAFKAYDVRGVVPSEVNAEMAYRVGRVFAAMFAAEKVVVGHDIRLSGRELVDALTEGLRHGGSDVIDIGQCGTEMIYFATAHLDADGGIMVTASHNPAEYNGMKLVRRGARPISADTGLMEIADMVVDSKDFPHVKVPGKTEGSVRRYDIMPEYIEHLLGYIDVQALKPLKIVANPGNGGAGPVLNELAKYLPFEFIKINETPDGTFPNGVPNPLLVPNREATAKLVRENGADLGVAWDGDFDRCFLFDEKAEFIEGYYIVGLLAEVFLRKQPGAKIMYDPRLTWNTQEVVDAAGGTAVRCKSGHAFMKECMRANEVLYGGEMSAHHYFKDFSYCDSGMIPWLLVAELLCTTGKTLSELVAERMEKFPCSGEINRKVEDSAAVLAAIEAKYADGGQVDKLDGLSIDYADWRFNVRVSNTEPVMRLNVETRGDKKLLAEKTAELLAMIGGEEA
ncbi:MAG: phosphomannomutase [Phascolarctobacterium sp.]|uniref:phosphomannomutase n=1 Tax=Phascolarctobacterium sp. TaxID=2049039 RepID=UPI0025EBBA2C|nr:phosphomannomutase [Phascolarctobacterium sp.]MCC8157930.1 phosphomannomutase [Phascolarctobacterium sp.]